MSNKEQITDHEREQILETFDLAIEALEGGLTDIYATEQILFDAGLSELSQDQETVIFLLSVIKLRLGVNLLIPEKERLVKDNVIVEGVAGQPSEGGGVASIYKTNKEGIFIRIVNYKNPKVGKRIDFINNPDLKI